MVNSGDPNKLFNQFGPIHKPNTYTRIKSHILKLLLQHTGDSVWLWVSLNKSYCRNRGMLPTEIRVMGVLGGSARVRPAFIIGVAGKGLGACARQDPVRLSPSASLSPSGPRSARWAVNRGHQVRLDYLQYLRDVRKTSAFMMRRYIAWGLVGAR